MWTNSLGTFLKKNPLMYISGDYAKFKEKPKINRNPKKLPLLQHNLMNHGSSSHTHT